MVSPSKTRAGQRGTPIFGLAIPLAIKVGLVTPSLKNIPCHVLVVFIALLAGLVLSGCTTNAQAQFYRPANYAGEPYRISGKFEPMSGWNGVVSIFINDKEVIKKPLPAFTNTTDASGEFEGMKVSVTITRVTTFGSNFTRAEVFIGSERAATLTF